MIAEYSFINYPSLPKYYFQENDIKRLANNLIDLEVHLILSDYVDLSSLLKKLFAYNCHVLVTYWNISWGKNCFISA